MTINSSTVCFILVKQYIGHNNTLPVYPSTSCTHTHKHTHTAMSLVCPTLTSIVKGYHQGQSCAPTSALRPSLFSFSLGNQNSFQKRATAFHLTSSAAFYPTYTPHYTRHKHTHITSIPHINIKSYT